MKESWRMQRASDSCFRASGNTRARRASKEARSRLVPPKIRMARGKVEEEEMVVVLLLLIVAVLCEYVWSALG